MMQTYGLYTRSVSSQVLGKKGTPLSRTLTGECWGPWREGGQAGGLVMQGSQAATKHFYLLNHQQGFQRSGHLLGQVPLLLVPG